MRWSGNHNMEGDLEAMTQDRDRWKARALQWEQRCKEAWADLEAVEQTGKIAQTQAKHGRSVLQRLAEALREKVGGQRAHREVNTANRDANLLVSYEAVVSENPQWSQRSPNYRAHGNSDKLSQAVINDYETRFDEDPKMSWKTFKRKYLKKLRKNSTL